MLRAQEFSRGVDAVEEAVPGHQGIVCTYPDDHNDSSIRSLIFLVLYSLREKSAIFSKIFFTFGKKVPNRKVEGVLVFYLYFDNWITGTSKK